MPAVFLTILMLSAFLILSLTADGRHSGWFLIPYYCWSSIPGAGKTAGRSFGLSVPAAQPCKKGGSMSKRVSEEAFLELTFLAALDSARADVDTSEIAEIQDWSGAVRGKFHGASVKELSRLSR